MVEANSAGSTAIGGQGPRTQKQTADAKGVVDSIKGTAKDMSTAVSDAAGQVSDKVQEWSSTAVTQVKEMTNDLASATADKAADLNKEVIGLIRRYPVQSVLVGFGIGFLLSRVMDSKA